MLDLIPMALSLKSLIYYGVNFLFKTLKLSTKDWTLTLNKLLLKRRVLNMIWSPPLLLPTKKWSPKAMQPAMMKSWVYLLLKLNLKYETILSCQCPQEAARKVPARSPMNFPLGFCSAIQLIALAYSSENPTST